MNKTVRDNEPALDIRKLMSAIDNDENEGMLNIDYAQLNKIKVDVLTELFLSGLTGITSGVGITSDVEKAFITIQKQLKEYRYVDQLKDIHFGSYIRWISLKNKHSHEIKLTNGGIVCQMPPQPATSNTPDRINIVCRNNMHRFFTVSMDENIIFQKLTDQEQVILAAMDYLSI